MRPFENISARRSRCFATLAVVASLSIAAAPAHAQTLVQFGDTISDPGVYVLAGNQSGSGDGIAIESDDVTLLLLRFTLRGDGTGVGVVSLGNDHVTIWGGRVTNFKTGVSMSEGEECTVRDIRIDHNGSAGLVVRSVDESSFLRMSSDYNAGNGVEATNCYESRFVSILAHHNAGNGIFMNNILVATSDIGNTVRLCWAAYNGLDGIHLRDTEDNLVKSNQCVGNDGAGIRLASSSQSTDTSAGPVAGNTHDNEIRSNWCVFNGDGIIVEEPSTSNTLTNNTALANRFHDMIEDNPEPPCANTWFLNFFLTKDGEGEDCVF